MKFLRLIGSLCLGFRGYRDIRDLPVSTSIKFLLKLVTLLVVIMAVSFVPVALQQARQIAEFFDKGRPDFSITDGRVHTKATQPVRWGDNTVRFILDTGGDVAVPETNTVAGLVFRADRYEWWVANTNVAPAVVRTGKGSLRGFPSGEVNGEYVHHLIRQSLPVALPLGVVALTLIGTLIAMLQAYIFALAGSIMERAVPGRLQLGQLLNIAIHAVTPAAVLFTAYTVMRLPDIDLWLVYLVAYGIFLLGATHACRDREPEREDDSDLML